MIKKYRQKYDYKNYISHCPNCGAPLQKNATDCHACGINLVGYNEKQNMASNMSEYANKMKQMVEKNNQLNERIRQENKKQENKLKAKKMISFLPIAIILLLIVGVVIYSLIITALNEIKSQNKEEVVEYLQNTD